MQELEKILEEIEAEHPYKVPGNYDSYSQYNEAWQDAIDRVRARLEEFFQEKENDGWIPVEERMPEKNEYFVDTSSNKEFPNGYYRRLEIAYMTDTVEYIHGYYDGYKWMDEWYDIIKNVVAWKIHEPYRPERSSNEEE